MDIEARLNQLADRYRSQGYQVVVHPESNDLPDFARTFKVEIVARRGDGAALVAAKKSPKELEADPNVAHYADSTAKQPGWRFDLVVMGPDDEDRQPVQRDAKEPSEEDLRQQWEIVRRLLEANANQQALVLAWSVLEAAMRRRLRAEGEEADWETWPRTMLNELLSSGALSHSVFRHLEGLFHARSAIAHGFIMPSIEPSAVQFILEVARQFFEEPKPAKQPA